MVKMSKIVAISFYLVLVLFAFKPALAFDYQGLNFTASVGSAIGVIGGFFNFFSQTIFGKIKADFCGNYRSSIVSGEWQTGEFRTEIGQSICPQVNTIVSNTKPLPKTNTQSTSSPSVSVVKINSKNISVPSKSSSTQTKPPSTNTTITTNIVLAVLHMENNLRILILSFPLYERRFPVA